MIKAIGLDLGHTLVYTPGVPLNWQILYEPALKEVARECNLQIKDAQISSATAILATYNTRLNPRDKEITSEEIFRQILATWDIPTDRCLALASRAFFEFFQRDSIVYDDVIPTLRNLKQKKIKIGILTDVAYGMEKAFAERDMEEFAEYIDGVLTSTEVGFRKPRPEGYIQLARRLEVDTGQMLFVGDEPKDIIGANAAGLVSVLIERGDGNQTYGESRRISSLLELLEMV